MVGGRFPDPEWRMGRRANDGLSIRGARSSTDEEILGVWRRGKARDIDDVWP